MRTTTAKVPRQDIGKIQRRTLMVLAVGTILGGLGVGASSSVGALLLAQVSGSDAISGLASATFNAGAALAGIPLARLATRKGRRHAIVTGNSVAMVGAFTAVYATVINQWWLLAVGIAVLGVASAVQLLARFSATDLAQPSKRARDLSLVVWSITVGAVVGPNLMGPGAIIGKQLGLTPLAGVFVFTIVAQFLAAIVSWVGLRPDSLLLSRELPSVDHDASGKEIPRQTISRRGQFQVIGVIAIAQAVMVALMAMAPLHIIHSGGTNEMVGFTLSLHIAGMYAFSPLFGMLCVKIGRINVVWIGWVILLLAAGLALFADQSHFVMEAAMILLGVGWGAVTVAGATLITELTPIVDRTKRQGMSDTLMSASGAVAAVFSGLIFAVAGYAVIAVVCAGLVTVGVFFTLSISRQTRRGEREASAYSAPV